MKKVLAIIPSHNEEKNVPLVIRGLKAQTYPTTICIVSDNSTDKTVEVAKSLGADIVTETVGNKGMRSGAINWGLERFAKDYDFILAMDADSTCAPTMIEEGVKALEEDPKLGAVCSRCGVLPQPELKTLEQKLLWHLQNVEYGTYDSSRVETTGRIKIAHGLATMFRREALEQQREKRGYVYNPEALTEDYCLTMDLKGLGWKATSCQKMLAWTIVPTTFKWLWKQRNRWNLGAIDSLLSHGISWITIWDYVAHISSIMILLIQIALMIFIGYLVAIGQSISFSMLFFAVIGIVWISEMYRLRYCQNIRIWDVLVVALFLPMELYLMFLLGSQLNSYKQFIMGEKRTY